MSESLMLADENWYSSNSIDILLGDNVFFVGRRHDKKTRLQFYREDAFSSAWRSSNEKILHSQWWQIKSSTVEILGIWEIA